MFRKDRNKDVDGLLIYVNQDLNCEIANTYDFSTETDILPLELAVTKWKLLILGLHKIPSPRS